MKKWILFSLVYSLAVSAHVNALTKCQASVNGYKIKTVYVTGEHYSAVVWAYKHLSDETCLTPVTNPAKADAILDLPAPELPAARPSGDDVLSITCSSSGTSSSCIDSNGNELDIDCDRAGNCTSYYGPSPAVSLIGAFNIWVGSASYQGEAHLYTPDHKLIWKSENQQAHWPDTLWYEKLRVGTNSPACRKPAFTTHYYRTFRQLASGRCGVEFDPPVSIDIKANERLAAKQAATGQKQSEADEMKRNAQDAAAKQSSSTQ